MGGTMWAESEEGSGSTFHVDLPVEATEAPTLRAAHGTPPQLAGKRILVVDDNITNHEIVARHARSWGMDAVALRRRPSRRSLESREPRGSTSPSSTW